MKIKHIRELPNIDQVLFLDIETIPKVEKFSKLSQNMKELFSSKFSWMLDLKRVSVDNEILGVERNPTIEELFDLYDEKAGVCSEFLQVVAVAIGGVQDEELKVKSYLHDNETKLLRAVSEALKSNRTPCAHSGKTFDFPVLARRYLVNSLPIPKKLDNYDVKPWEQDLIDTMEVWKCGQSRYSVSLALLCEVLGIKTSKNGMDGSKVLQAWEKKEFDKIKKYVRSDVIDEAKIYTCFLGENFSYSIQELDEEWK